MELDRNKNEKNLLPPSDLVGDIQRSQEELINERDRNIRTHADFKNYRRRIERECSKIAEESIRGMMLALLEIINNIEKALQFATDEDQPYMEGMQIIHQQLLTLVERHGVLPFESVGMAFDHNLHDAVAMEKKRGIKPGTVVSELCRGYLWNNRLLRPAQVRVSE